MPTWKLDYKNSIHTQMDLLPYTDWGSDVSVNYSDPVMATDLLQKWSRENATLEQNNSLFWYDEFGHPMRTDSVIWNLVAMPHHWGSGMLFHSGNEALSGFGNSIDRVQQNILRR